jgi:hypothetical protein
MNVLFPCIDIAADVSTAIQDKDASKLAPESLAYGKAFVEFQKFQKQLVTDIIPDLLTKGYPSLHFYHPLPSPPILLILLSL